MLSLLKVSKAEMDNPEVIAIDFKKIPGSIIDITDKIGKDMAPMPRLSTK